MEIVTNRNNYRIIQLLSGRCNVFMVSNGKTIVIIDSGISWMRKRLHNKLISMKINHVDFLILTHNHFDHTGNAAWIREHFNARVIIHQSEATDLESGITKEMPDGTTWITKPLVRFINKCFHPSIHVNPCKADITTNEAFSFENAGLNMQIIHTPGHTPGSQSVIIDDEIAVTGDSMFGVFPGSIMPPFGYHIPQIIASWEKLLKTGCRLFLPAHGSANTRHLVEKQYAYYKNLLKISS